MIGIGGIKALFIGQQDPPYIKAINEYAFVEEYLDHYLHYPQTDSDKDYLNMFTLNNSWRCEYDNKGIETADLNTVSIYEAVVSENANVYYARVNLTMQTKEKETKQESLWMKVTLAQKNDAYLISAPITMAYTQAQGMSEEEKKLYEQAVKTEGEECSETERQELEQTVQLFLKTYGSDYEQARLLMRDPNALDRLDPSTQIVLENVSSIRKKEKSYFINISVRMESAEMLIQRKNYHFEIDQTTNKIERLEEY